MCEIFFGHTQKALTLRDDVLDLLTLVHGDVAEDRENGESSDDACGRVDQTDGKNAPGSGKIDNIGCVLCELIANYRQMER